MAIYKPGQRHRNHNILKRRGHRRNVTVILSLTAMVDMFTVLVIFLLQNYNATGEIIHIPKEVVLPKASRVLELKPSLIVTVSGKEVLIDKTPVATFEDVKQSQNWIIPNLRDQAKIHLDAAKAAQDAKLQTKINKVVGKTIGEKSDDVNAWKKVTIQADKGVDFLTLKKVMYSLYLAGAGPINFAVAKESNKENATTKTENK